MSRVFYLFRILSRMCVAKEINYAPSCAASFHVHPAAKVALCWRNCAQSAVCGYTPGRRCSRSILTRTLLREWLPAVTYKLLATKEKKTKIGLAWARCDCSFLTMRVKHWKFKHILWCVRTYFVENKFDILRMKIFTLRELLQSFFYTCLIKKQSLLI